jgi:hypothetical protein
MNLPNYFIADLPPEAPLTAGMITEACHTLRRNREQYLAQRSTASIITTLARVADNWLDAEYPFRQLALEHGPARTGFSRLTLAAGLDAFFRRITAENLDALVEHEFGHAGRLDSHVASPVEQQARRTAVVTGPELLAHIGGGALPNPTLLSLIHGLLVRSSQFVKCATGGAFLPRLFAHSLYEADPKLATCVEIAEWPGGTTNLEQALFNEVDCLTATGSDETLHDIRHRLPARVRYLPYGHRVSFGYIAKSALVGFGSKKVAGQAAADVIAWNQLGCLSPHLFYVQEEGGVSAEEFAAGLAVELGRREQTHPRDRVPVDVAAGIASRRALHEMRSAHAPDATQVWASENSTAWTVVFESDPRFQHSCLHRFIYVKPVTSLSDALQNADAIRRHVSTVGLAASGVEAEQLALQLARWGASRVCPIGQMQNPPLFWRHDGRPSLGDLVTWTDWEL